MGSNISASSPRIGVPILATVNALLIGYILYSQSSKNPAPAPDAEPAAVGTDDKVSSKGRPSNPGLRRNAQSFVWASGRSNVEIVVTGVSAALPGRNGSVFPATGPALCNIQRIIAGENFITSIPDDVKDAMLEKNVVKLGRGDDGKLKKYPVTEYEQSVNVSASIGSFDLTRYGVSESIASTMDTAVQVSVAAGLEALLDAGIVSGKGEGTSGWVLPESMQKTTGVVYATSFPALDTAISEVSRFFRTKFAEQADLSMAMGSLRSKLVARLGNVNEGKGSNALPASVEAALQEMQVYLESTASGDKEEVQYEFDRKFLFRVLVLGNAQLAQIVKARGPNMQTNAACAGNYNQ